MDTLNPSMLAEWTGGEWRNGSPDHVASVANDTRRLQPGQLFAALRTGARDGHDFISSALESGAAGAIVDRFQPSVSLPQLVVADVGRALLEAARTYRHTWRAKVVGITGSCGKTTCKEILSCLLSGTNTLITQGNLNNLLGVPMSMLKPEASYADYAVLEAGISEPGEMAQLAKTIDPEVGIITAIGAAHLEALRSVENIAIEKGKLLQTSRAETAFVGESALPFLKELGCEQAVPVVPDDDLSAPWAYRFEFSKGRTRLRQRIGENVQDFEYEGTGEGLASNVALAIAAATVLGVEVAALRTALTNWKPSHMRNEWRRIGQRRVFLDCYNANPVSMRDSLRTFLRETPPEGPRCYVIGCMEELGEESRHWHERLGRELALQKEDLLLVIGSEAASVLRGMKETGRDSEHCFEIRDLGEAERHLEEFAGDIFLKGSRRYKLETLLDVISERRARC